MGVNDRWFTFHGVRGSSKIENGGSPTRASGDKADVYLRGNTTTRERMVSPKENVTSLLVEGV